MQFNAQSLRDRNNMFKLNDFDNFLNSPPGMELQQTVQANEQNYIGYFDYMKADINQFQFSHEDQAKVLPQLMSNMDLNFLHNVVNYKMGEIMKMRGDYNLMQNQYLRTLLFKALIYADATQKCEQMFPYQPGVFFDWTNFYNGIERADPFTLEQRVNSM